MSKYPVIIGRAEPIALVGLAEGVPAKIDTGAYRSAIHATKAKVIERDGKKHLQFSVLGHKCAPDSHKVVVNNFEEITIRSSNGALSNRYAVNMRIKIGPKVFTTSFTLANRSDNVYPILIGRDALRGRCIVDPSRAGISRQKLSDDFGISIETPEDMEG